MFDSGFLLIENFGRLAALVGVAISVPLFAYSGYLFMTSMGDPNRSAQARNAVLSVIAGVIIVGCSFMLPVVIGEFVVAPVGGIELEVSGSVNCDQILRDQLFANREASTAVRINFLISRIQNTYDDCHVDLWYPRVRTDQSSGNVGHACFDSSNREFISGVAVPRGLFRGGSISQRSGRDARGNVIVHWDWNAHDGGSYRPSDGSICWMYVASLGQWVEGRQH